MDDDFPDPARAQKTLGVMSIVMGLLGLTAVIVPSLFAVAMGRTSRDLYAQGHRGSRRNLGDAGVRLGYLGLSIAAVAVAVFALSAVIS